MPPYMVEARPAAAKGRDAAELGRRRRRIGAGGARKAAAARRRRGLPQQTRLLADDAHPGPRRGDTTSRDTGGRRPRREPGGPDSINKESAERGGGLLPLRRADRSGDAWRREGPDLAGKCSFDETIIIKPDISSS